MPINPSIALSVKPVEFQDPTVAYGRIAAIQQAQQQNALAQMQMAEYARARQEEEGVRNYLAGKDISAPDTQAGLYQYGKTGIDYAAKLQAAQKARMEQQSAELKLAGDRAEQAGRIYGTVTDQASWDRAKPKLAALGGDPTKLPEQFDPAFINSEIQSALSVKDRLEQHFVNQDVGASTRVLTMPKYGGGPAAVVSGSDVAKTLPPQARTTLAKLQAERDALPEGDPRRAAYDDMIAKETKVPFQRVATDMGGNILGGRFNPATGLTEYTETVAKSLPPAPPKEAPAPTVTQVIDPNNPERMLTVDARRYQGGSEGAPGVIGVAGKEPSAALRNTKIEQGKTQLQDDLDNLRASFTALNDMRAIPSTERGVISNLMAASQSSGVGQALGRATGTKEQVERDVISSAKQRLLTSIKNATGMSAQQLNSNMELQAMLRSLSDVNLGFEASMRIIDDIEDTYVKGAAKKAEPATGNAPKPVALSSVDQQALDWANANPKDPRAAQIKQRLGR